MRYIIFSLLFCLQAGAQQMPDYIVYLVKGDVAVHKGSEKPAKPKQHQLIYATETVTIKQGGEVTLSDKNGSSFVLNTPGAYTVKSLSKRTAKATDNLTKKYLNLLYHELIDPGHDYNKFKKQNVGGVWGGVSRGDCGNMLFPVQNMKTTIANLPFVWKKTSAVNIYQLKIFDQELKELASLPVNDTVVSVDLANYILKPGKYYWLIQGQDASCEDEMPASFEIISKDDELKKIAELEKANEAISNKLWVIEQLEKECYIPMAQKYFVSLINNNQGDTSLVKTYTWFLLKHNMEEDAQKAWQKLMQ